jgi:hypothetical protein
MWLISESVLALRGTPKPMPAPRREPREAGLSVEELVPQLGGIAGRQPGESTGLIQVAGSTLETSQDVSWNSRSGAAG